MPSMRNETPIAVMSGASRGAVAQPAVGDEFDRDSGEAGGDHREGEDDGERSDEAAEACCVASDDRDEGHPPAMKMA